MRILLVSNLYAPFTVGGYELRCQWVAEELVRRGYEVHVFCSLYGTGLKPATEVLGGVHVHRFLRTYAPLNTKGNMNSLFQVFYKSKDLRTFSKKVKRLQADVICWWNMGGIFKGLLVLPGIERIPDVFWFEDLWPNQIGVDAGCGKKSWANLMLGCHFRIVQKCGQILLSGMLRLGIPLSLGDLQPCSACFVSEYQQAAHLDFPLKYVSKNVIYGSPLPNCFWPSETCDWASISEGPIPLLYCGAITKSRRLDILLRAIKNMGEVERSCFTVSVVGAPPVPEENAYFEQMKSFVQENNLSDIVHFVGQVPHKEIPSLLRKHALYILPTARPEGFPIAMAEAMLSGCQVVTSGAGGALEMAKKCNAEVFPVDDVSSLKKVLLSYSLDRKKLADARELSNRKARELFDFDKMVDAYEAVLIASLKTYE